MKPFVKHLLPDVHLDPIQRDLLAIVGASFVVAAILVTAASFFFH